MFSSGRLGGALRLVAILTNKSFVKPAYIGAKDESNRFGAPGWRGFCRRSLTSFPHDIIIPDEERPLLDTEYYGGGSSEGAIISFGLCSYVGISSVVFI